MFAGRGVQPGQRLPKLSLTTLDGAPAEIELVRAGRPSVPMVLVTVSLTCNVARHNQTELEALARRWGDRAAFVVVYTIDAHPFGAVCPYTGSEWVPEDNRRDDVLVGQPHTLAERRALARQYADRFDSVTTILVDTIDNASWIARGKAPNVGLLVGADGVVRERQGWFDAAAMDAALIAVAGQP
jgi:hypothetical protein